MKNEDTHSNPDKNSLTVDSETGNIFCFFDKGNLITIFSEKLNNGNSYLSFFQ